MERRRVNGNGVVYVLANGKEQQPKIQYDDPELGHQVIHPGNVCFVSSGDGPHRAAQRIQFTLVEENEHRNDQQGGGKRSQGPDPIPFASRKKIISHNATIIGRVIVNSFVRIAANVETREIV